MVGGKKYGAPNNNLDARGSGASPGTGPSTSTVDGTDEYALTGRFAIYGARARSGENSSTKSTTVQ